MCLPLVTILICAIMAVRIEAADFYTAFPEINLDGSAHVSLIVYGEIVPGDSQRLEEIVNTLNANGVLIRALNLYSPGGSLVEGLAIGRLARSLLIRTSAPLVVSEGTLCWTDRQIIGAMDLNYPGYFTNAEDPMCVCASACALAWLGGVSRTGTVGFHHVFLRQQQGVTFSFADHSARLDEARMIVSEFLHEVRAPRLVEDAIFSTASDHLSVFDSNQVAELRWDPLFREYILSRCPRRSDRLFDDLVCQTRVLDYEARFVQLARPVEQP